MKSQFRNRAIGGIRPQPAAANVVIVAEHENRPVLKVVHFHPLDLALQSQTHFLIGERPSKKSRNLYISPQLTRQWKIFQRPAAEPKPLTFHEIRIDECAAHLNAFLTRV